MLQKITAMGSQVTSRVNYCGIFLQDQILYKLSEKHRFKLDKRTNKLASEIASGKYRSMLKVFIHNTCAISSISFIHTFQARRELMSRFTDT